MRPFFVFVLLCIGFVSCKKECVIKQNIDNVFYEIWDFRVPKWADENEFVAIDTQPPNRAPGWWTYEINFCNGVRLYQGDKLNNQSGLPSWSYGEMTYFDEVDHLIPNTPEPQPPYNTTAYIRFVQEYSGGDKGENCADTTRSARVNVYCGGSEANCTVVPGSDGPACLGVSSFPTPGFCMCSLFFNETGGLCRGLTLNLLSRSCPSSRSENIVPGPSPGNSPEEVVGIVFLVLFILLLLSCVGGYAYNYSVHAKRGASAIPFYDTCRGESNQPVYESAPTNPPPSYGTVTPQ